MSDWPTPCGTNKTCRRPNGNGKSHAGETLLDAMLLEGEMEPWEEVQMPDQEMWPTPRMSEYKGCGPQGSKSQQFMLDKSYLCAVVSEEESMSSSEASPVRTSLSPGAGADLTESAADSTPRCFVWFARWEPDTSSWRTCQLSLFGDSEEFSETWPRWGTTQNGDASRLVT